MEHKLELPRRTLFCDTLGMCCQVMDENCKQCEFYEKTFKRTTQDILAETDRLLKKYGDTNECKISKRLTKREAVQRYFNIISELWFRIGYILTTTPDDYIRHKNRQDHERTRNANFRCACGTNAQRTTGIFPGPYGAGFRPGQEVRKGS